MASTVLSNIIEPSVFLSYVQYVATQTSDFWTSGIVQSDPVFDAVAHQGGRTFNMPKWGDLATTEPNRSHDSGTATALNIAAFKEIAVKQYRNQVWGSMDIVQSIAGSDPLMAIANSVGRYWSRVMQDILIKTIVGIMADNVDNDSGDMVNSIYSDVPSGSLTVSPISVEAQTCGALEKMTLPSVTWP